MRSLLAVDGSDGPDSLADLRDWLSDEALLRGRVHVPPSVPGTGELGAWSDTLIVAVGAGGALTALARAVAVYVRQPRRSTVRVKVVAPDGTRTELTVQHAKNLDAVENLLRTALHSDTDTGREAVSDGATPALGGASEAEG
ncbi:effector-associated constant component EACC1 [Streptomyces arboris]|uniref:effector-associated constant component EACC1 n=1 Tax=Streptomyces arboris TaxID=2600619 RepID=UPI003BF4B4A1